MKNRMGSGWMVLLVLVGLSFASCHGGKKVPVVTETPTRGNIKIGVDDAFHLLGDSEVSTFEALYKYAHITPIYASEDSILRLFLNDSIRLMITSRKLTDNEIAFLRDKLIVARTTQIAWDAVAFIVNQNNPDSLIKYNMLKDIFSGKVSTWKQINGNNRLGKLKVVFDSPRSGNVRLIQKKFALTGPLPEFCYSTHSNPDVIDYVEKHPEAIGVISVNWISDKDDSLTHAFLKKIRVLAVTPDFEPDGDEYYTPHPAYIADKSYPFIREVYAIKRETFEGLGSGFIQFVAADQGQRIILKMGLVPATMPIRLVHIVKE